MDFLQYLYTPFQWFAINPAAVFAVAAIFVFPVFLPNYAVWARITLVIVALNWFVYAIWESRMSAGHALPIDLASRAHMLQLCAALLAAAFAGVYSMVFGRKNLLRSIKRRG